MSAEHYNDASKFGKDYFVNSDISNYEDYRKKKFESLANDIISAINLSKNHYILDFGCATGGLLYQFKKLGFEHIRGTDISMWSITYGLEHYGLENHLDYYNVNLLREHFDYTLFLDVLEHIPKVQMIEQYLSICNSKYILVRLPVSENEGEPYVLPVSRNDKTHVQCHTKEWWIKLFEKFNYFPKKYMKEEETPSIYESAGVLAVLLQKKKEAK